MSSSINIPIGFRFDPTDEELIRGFLYPRVKGHFLPWDGVADRKVYGADAEPWKVFSDADDGPSPYWQTKIEGGAIKKSIYVFTKLTMAAPNSDNSTRASRIAGCGAWVGQTGLKKIKHSDTGDIIGGWRMLSFQCSSKKDSAKYTKDLVGHWIMHEYSLSEAALMMATGKKHSDLVLCKITKCIKIKNKNNKDVVSQQYRPHHIQQTAAAAQYYSPVDENVGSDSTPIQEMAATAAAVQYYSPVEENVGSDRTPIEETVAAEVQYYSPVDENVGSDSTPIQEMAAVAVQNYSLLDENVGSDSTPIEETVAAAVQYYSPVDENNESGSPAAMRGRNDHVKKKRDGEELEEEGCKKQKTSMIWCFEDVELESMDMADIDLDTVDISQLIDFNL